MTFSRQLLSIMKVREDYLTLEPGVNYAALDKTTSTVLKDFGTFFEEFPEVTCVEPETYMTWWRDLAGKERKADEIQLMDTVLRAVSAPVEQAVYDGITTKLREREFASKLADMLTKYKLGAVTGLHEQAQALCFQCEALTKEEGLVDAFAASFEELLTEKDGGFRFHSRLTCINNATGGWPIGKAVILSAMTDGGKTTFLASEATHYAKQARLSGQGPVLVLSNEGDIADIRLRFYQAGAGMSTPDMLKNRDAALLRYEKEVGPTKGRDQALFVVNANGWSVFQAERVIRSLRPSLVMFDMLANFRGFENEKRDDQRLERLAQWAREKADRYRFLSFATWQMSDEARNEQYPAKECLHGSKIGVQGACDTILTFTRSVEKDAAKEQGVAVAKKKAAADKAVQNLVFSRYIGAPKQKIAGPNGARSFRDEVVADFNRGRVMDASNASLM